MCSILTFSRIVQGCLLILLLSGCMSYPPAKAFLHTDQSLLNELKNKTAPESVAILPFTGNQVFRRVGTELFGYHLHKHHPIRIIHPAVVEVDATAAGAPLSAEKISVAEAVIAGRRHNVDIIIFGDLSFVGIKDVTLGVSMIDARTGKVIVTSSRSGKNSSMLLQLPRHRQEAVASAARTVSFDILEVLHQLTSSDWQRPVEPVNAEAAGRPK